MIAEMTRNAELIADKFNRNGLGILVKDICCHVKALASEVKRLNQPKKKLSVRESTEEVKAAKDIVMLALRDLTARNRAGAESLAAEIIAWLAHAGFVVKKADRSHES